MRCERISTRVLEFYIHVDLAPLMMIMYELQYVIWLVETTEINHVVDLSVSLEV